MTIVLASGNAHKIAEIRTILRREIGEEAELLSLADVGFHGEIEESGATFEENACIKASAGAGLGYISMADDSGLSVEALGGAPGVFSARYAGEPCNDKKNNEKLLAALDGLSGEGRRAKFVSVIACLFPDGDKIVVRGECEGLILREYRGKGGFGYDPLFYYPPLGKTFAELTGEEKNSVSHRARAMEKFIAALREKIKK